MTRPVIEGDFRSNVSQGSKPKNIKLTELEIEETLKAAKAVGGYWTAVDFIPSKNRDKEPPYFLEVNSSPQTEGIEDATGMNIAKDVINHFADGENRYTVPTECGFKEILTIKPLANLYQNLIRVILACLLFMPTNIKYKETKSHGLC